MDHDAMDGTLVVVPAPTNSSSGTSAAGSSATGCNTTNENPQTHEVAWCLGDCNSAIEISVGDTVTFINTDGLPHTVTDASCGDHTQESQNQGCAPQAFDHDLPKDSNWSWTFNECGIHHYFCEIHPSMAGKVIVGGVEADLSPAGSYHPFAIAHGSLMFIAFGAFLPFGGFLAVSGRMRAHYVCQITGLCMALAGFVMILYFNATVQKRHFGHIHGVIGMVLISMAFVIQPLAVFLGFRKKLKSARMFLSLHRRNGQMLVFFGIANVFMGFLAMNVGTGIRVAYGCWVGFMILVYMLYQPMKTDFKRGKAPKPRGFRASHVKLGGATVGVSSDNVPRGVGEAVEMREMAAVEEQEGETGYGFGAAEPAASELASTPQQERTAVEEMSLQAILSSSRDAIVGADENGDITSWSAGAVTMFGYAASEVVGESLQLLMPEGFRRRHQNGIDRQASSAKAKTPGKLKKYNNIYQVRGVSKSGAEFPIEVSVTSFAVKGKMHFSGIIKDLSDEVAALPPAYTPVAGGGQPVELTTALVDRLRKQAVALGAAMKNAHALESDTHITRQELTAMLAKNFKDSKIDHGDLQAEKIDSLVDALMVEGARGGDRIYFVDLVGLLSKHGLAVGETGDLKTIKTSQEAQEDTGASQRLQDWWTNEGSKFVILVLYYGLNIFLATWNGITYRNSGANIWIQLARAGGLTLDFNCAIIVLPMCRKVLGLMRATWLVKVIPFDSSIEFHKLIAYNIIIGAVLHTVGHFGNYATLPEAFATYLFETNAGITGFLIWIVMIIMYIGASERIRRGDARTRGASSNTVMKRLKSHAIFFFTHHFFVFFFALLIIHGLHFLNPNFWKWFVGPGAVYVAERAYREAVVKREPLKIVKAVPMPGNVTAISVTKPAHWKCKPGQYIFIQIPAVSRFEWHPFTLTSAPEDEYVSVMIRKVGDWTGDVFDLFKDNPVDAARAGAEEGAEGEHLPEARIDGPYGAATEEVFDFEYAVLVGAGIGSTPAASILKHIKYRLAQVAKTGERCRFCKFKLKKLYFVWSNRDAGAFRWFADYLAEIQSAEIVAQATARKEGREYEPLIDIRVFFTAVRQGKDDLSTMMLHLGLESAHQQTQTDVITNLRSITTFGRPKFDVLFDELKAKHTGQTFGVFFCGPAVLGSTLRKACRASSTVSTKFLYKQEVF